jgi:hypothetical protein
MGTLHGQELISAERYELHHAREKLKSVQKRIALFHTRMEGELPCVSSMAEIQALDNERETLRATIATLRKPDPDRQPTVEAPAITAAAAAAAEPAAAVVEYRAVTVTINEPEAEPANAPVPSTRPRRKKGRK